MKLLSEVQSSQTKLWSVRPFISSIAIKDQTLAGLRGTPTHRITQMRREATELRGAGPHCQVRCESSWS